MNYRLLSLLAALLAITTAALLSCSPVSEPELSQAEKPGGPPALVIDQDAPLLLDEPGRAENPLPAASPHPQLLTKQERVLAENGPCFVCHVNYQAEPLAKQHAGADVGCVSCHGPSYAHRNDENNTTPPDVMYPRNGIDPACRKCHASHDVPAGKIVTLWLQRFADKTDAQSIVCTDCHGDHRLKVRTVRWDKKTGKLL
jgi:hypothetical protein